MISSSSSLIVSRDKDWVRSPHRREKMSSGKSMLAPSAQTISDIVSLCCHIDEDHPMDTINGITSWGLRRWSSYSLEDGQSLERLPDSNK
ncbi:hypothetical protein YC2023_010673 [Brassica napus]